MLIHLYEDENITLVHRIDKYPKSEDFPWMVAHKYSLVYHISGDITYYIKNDVYKPKSGDIMLFDFKETRKMVINRFVPYERILIQFKKVYDGKSIIKYPSFSTLGFGTINYIEAGKQKGNLSKPLNDIIALTGDFSAEIITNLNIFIKELQNSVTTLTGMTNGEIYFKIIKYIESDLSADFSLDSIAKRFNISRSKLTRLFRERGETTVWGYITRRRLEKANEMLSNGEKPLDVSVKYGFKDYSVFYRAYKNKFGFSPKSTPKN